MIKKITARARNIWLYHTTSLQRMGLIFIGVLFLLVSTIAFIFWLLTWSPIVIGIFVLLMISLAITATICWDYW